MIRRLLRWTALLLVAFVAIAAGLYALGMRVVLDGGGGLHLGFPESAKRQAAAVERHREAQRASAPEAGAADPVAAAEPSGALPAPAVVRPGDWTDFRGPWRDGHYRDSPVRTSWPDAGLTPLWRQPVGAGYASFVVARGRAFTIEQRGPEEVVAAYDVMTGRERWTNRWTAAFREFMGGDGPRATPTWYDGIVYALGAEGELRALDEATGRVRWRTNILDDAGAANLDWGMSASPLVLDGRVIVLPGGPNGRSVAAYHRLTGERLWSTLDDKAAYASPMVVTLAGVRHLVVVTARRLVGLTTDGQHVLWEYPWRTEFDVNASQPLVIDESRLFYSTGYGVGAAVLEFTREGEALAVRDVWKNIRMKNQFTSSVLHEGFVYGLDESILACVDAATGDLKWKGGRYGYGQVMLAGGHLVVLTEQGDLVLVEATPERHVEKARFHAFDGKTWNHPAMAGGILLVRNLREMAAFDLRK